MTVSQARRISTNQLGVNEDLMKVLDKHKTNRFKRPIARHTRDAFANMLEWLGLWEGEVFIDAGCGVGESTINIAAKYPHAKVVGVDKSIARLGKHKSYAEHSNANSEMAGSNPLEARYIDISDDNYLLLQADLNDFWRLLADYTEADKPRWHVAKQFILYPNPYPKKTQLGKRWHGSALFPFIVKISSNIEVRSNWRLYVDECLIAAEYYGLTGSIDIIEASDNTMPYTPFERKYVDSNQTCFKLVMRACGCDKK
jgi:tRNA (guanine-N7-)-methyltransferase